METGKRLQILLSTYNGEAYLREQLESYLTMERFQECCVLIRDDGSTDATQEILREYEKRPDFRIVYGENIGIIRSYSWLMENSDDGCEYFALSDQDDVWMKQKVAAAMDALDRYPREEKLLFASISRLVDENLNGIGFSQEPVKGMSYYNAMVQNVLPGHTQVFNKALRDSVLSHDCSEAHAIDWWLYLVASAVGRIAFCPEYTVLHRQHGCNAVGYKQGAWTTLKRRLNYIRDGKGNAISRQLKLFLEQYGSELSKEYRGETQAYLDGVKTVISRVRYLRHRSVFRQKRSENWKFCVLYLLGKYNV